MATNELLIPSRVKLKEIKYHLALLIRNASKRKTLSFLQATQGQIILIEDISKIPKVSRLC